VRGWGSLGSGGLDEPHPDSTWWLNVNQLLSQKAKISRTASRKNKNNIRTYDTLEWRIKKETQSTTLSLPGH